MQQARSSAVHRPPPNPLNMYRVLFPAALAATALAAPAQATQGIVCRTLDGPPRVYSLGAGTHGAATWWVKEQLDGKWLDREVGQHWIDDERLFLDLVNSDSLTRVARIEARWTGKEWVGAFRTDTRTQSMVCKPD